MKTALNLVFDTIENPDWKQPVNVRQGLFQMKDGQATRMVLSEDGLAILRQGKWVGVPRAELEAMADNLVQPEQG